MGHRAGFRAACSPDVTDRSLDNLRTPPPCKMTRLCCFLCVCAFLIRINLLLYSFGLPFPLVRDLSLHLHTPTIHDTTCTLLTLYSILTLFLPFRLRLIHLSFVSLPFPLRDSPFSLTDPFFHFSYFPIFGLFYRSFYLMYF